MARLHSFIAWALSIASVYASQPNVGWRVEVIAEEVSIGSDHVGDGIYNVFVDAPVNITRIGAEADYITLLFYYSYYLINNETDAQAPVRTLVHRQQVDAPKTWDTYTASFDFQQPTQAILLSVGIEDGSAPEDFISVDSTGVVLTQGEQGSWIPRVPADYDYEINMEFTAEHQELIKDGYSDGGERDLGIEPIVPPKDDLVIPKDNAPVDPSTPVTPTDPTSPIITTPVDPGTTPVDPGTTPVDPGTTPVDPGTPGGGTDPVKPTDPCDDESTPVTPTPTTPGGFITIIKTVTVTPPCDCEQSSPTPTCTKKIHARQDAVHPAYVRAKITFKDRNLQDQPLRLSTLFASANIFKGTEFVKSRPARAVTDVNGEAIFRFDVNYGERVEVHTFWVILDEELYRIGTLNSNGDVDIKVIKDEFPLKTYHVAAGEVVNVDHNFGYSEYNKALAVADTFRYITDWTKAMVTGGDTLEKAMIYFPGRSSGAFFMPLKDKPYLNLPSIDAANPSVMAHEYGHFIHFLARYKNSHDAGGDHFFCGDGDKKKVGTALSEGYATAFAMMALDDTPLIDKDWFPYITYQNREEYRDQSWTRNIEAFTCFERDMMLKHEGRVAAAMFDMVDRKLDDFLTFDSDLGRVGADFDPQMLNIKFTPRFIFWLLMRNNPPSIQDWWYVSTLISRNDTELIDNRNNLRTYPYMEKEWIDKAWAIMDYNYVDFPRE